MGNLPVSVVIITKNAAGSIEECLKSIQRNNPSEVIVVDGNSSDRTVEISRGYTSRIYSDGGKGKSYARQLGAEEATRRYIAYIDADIVLTEGALATMLAEIEGSDYACLSADILPPRRRLNYWEWAASEHNRLSKLRHRGGYVATAACMLKKEIILKYKFDTFHKGYIDDLGLELKLKRAGHRLGVSSVSIYYNNRDNLKSLVSHRIFLGRVTAFSLKEYGLWHAGFWPPLVMIYWLGFCLTRGKIKLIPYFIAEGVAKTVGWLKGFFELLKGERS